MFADDTPYKVYESSIWWSDSWSEMDYGRNFDFNRPFFEQFDALMKDVPHCNLFITGNNENSDYVNCAGGVE